MSAAKYSGRGAKAASANSARSPAANAFTNSSDRKGHTAHLSAPVRNVTEDRIQARFFAATVSALRLLRLQNDPRPFAAGRGRKPYRGWRCWEWCRVECPSAPNPSFHPVMRSWPAQARQGLFLWIDQSQKATRELSR